MNACKDNDTVFNITENLITSHSWMFVQVKLFQKNPIMFCVDGRIARYDHPNERYWSVSDNKLYVYHEDRSISSIFNEITHNNNKEIIISGYYIRDGSNIPLRIEKQAFESKPVIIKEYKKSSENVLMFVAYFHKGQPPAHIDILIREFKRHDIDIIIIICVDKEFENVIFANFQRQVAQSNGVLCRFNYGYDFSAWADCLRVFPSLWNSQKLFFMNDSLIGPLGTLDDLFFRINSHTEDFLGISFSWAIRPHIQSYFMVIQGSAIKHDKIQSFWRSIQELTKEEIILEYETRLFSYIQSWMLTIGFLYWGPDADGCRVNDPSGINWERLFSTGFPFIKLRVVKNSDLFTIDHINKYFHHSELRSILALEVSKGDR